MSKVSGHPYFLIIFGCHILQLSYFGNLSIEVHNERISIILEVEDITHEFFSKAKGCFLAKSWGWFWFMY